VIRSVKSKPLEFYTQALMTLLPSGITFGKMTVIVGDNGVGKSLLIGILCAAVDPQSHYDDMVFKSDIKFSPFSFLRDYVRNGYIEMEWDEHIPVIYHQGLDKKPHVQATERNCGSSGENVLYELLELTSDIRERYAPFKSRLATTGEEVIDYKTKITKKFVYGPSLDLELRKPAVLICDEPELGLSPDRVKAIIRYLIRWVDEGNQLILTTNHPWMTGGNWPPHLQAQVINLDSFASDSRFSYHVDI
jgi:energy-coupling factor transporter ATP-binding protein EcfA2